MEAEGSLKFTAQLAPPSWWRSEPMRHPAWKKRSVRTLRNNIWNCPLTSSCTHVNECMHTHTKFKTITTKHYLKIHLKTRVKYSFLRSMGGKVWIKPYLILLDFCSMVNTTTGMGISELCHHPLYIPPSLDGNSVLFWSFWHPCYSPLLLLTTLVWPATHLSVVSVWVEKSPNSMWLTWWNYEWDMGLSLSVAFESPLLPHMVPETNKENITPKPNVRWID